MCGGLATALGTQRHGTLRARPLLYQLGRVTSYGAAGAIVGSLGAAAGFAFETSKWSEVLRLGTAVIVVLIGLNIALGSRLRGPWLRAPERWGALVWRRIAPLASRLPTQPALRALTLGLLWGWLPCGLVYSVLLAAALAGSALAGSATMVAFGLGTLPAMLGLSYAGGRFAPPGATLSRLLGSVIVACGLWTASMPIAILFGAHQHVHAMVRGSSTLALP
jgi:sulfite exporter TauE/SafE